MCCVFASIEFFLYPCRTFVIRIISHPYPCIMYECVVLCMCIYIIFFLYPCFVLVSEICHVSLWYRILPTSISRFVIFAYPYHILSHICICASCMWIMYLCVLLCARVCIDFFSYIHVIYIFFF